MNVKALTFDVFGTVMDWRGGIAREIAALGATHGFNLDGNAFALAWRARYQPAMERVRSGARGFVKLDLLHRENLDQVLTEFDLGDLDEAERAALNLAWHRLDPWPDVVEGLTRLKRDSILATLSGRGGGAPLPAPARGLSQNRGLSGVGARRLHAGSGA